MSRLDASVIRRIANMKNGRTKYKIFPELEKLTVDLLLKAVESAMKGHYSCEIAVSHKLPQEYIDTIREAGFEINSMDNGTKYIIGWV